MICLCGKQFNEKGNAKTCSPRCSAVRKKRTFRVWYVTKQARSGKRVRRASSRELIAARRFDRIVDRAVRTLFAHQTDQSFS